MPSENHVKKRPAEEEPELAAVRAFVEHAFPLWVTRVSPDKLANGVAEMSVRWAQAGHNVPQVSNALKTQLAMDIPPEKILDILFAWEEVHKSRYLPETGKFMPLRQASGSRKSSTSETEKKASIKALESKIEELEKGLARAEKERSRSSKEDWLALPLTVQTIQDYRDSTTGLTGWMIDILDMVSSAVEENILDDPRVIQASDIWALVVKAQSSMRESTPGLVKDLRVLRKSAVLSPGHPGGPDLTGDDDTVVPNPALAPDLDPPAQSLLVRQGMIPRSSTTTVGSSASVKSMGLSTLSLPLANAGARTALRRATAISVEGATGSGNAPDATGAEAAPQGPGKAVGTSLVPLMSWKKVSHNGPNVLTTYARKKTRQTGGLSHSHRGPTRHSRSMPTTSKQWLPHSSHRTPGTLRSSYGSTFSDWLNVTPRHLACDRQSVRAGYWRSLTSAPPLSRPTHGDSFAVKRGSRGQADHSVGARWKSWKSWDAGRSHRTSAWSQRWPSCLQRSASELGKRRAFGPSTYSRASHLSVFSTKRPSGSGSPGQLGAILTDYLASCGFKSASRGDRPTSLSSQGALGPYPPPCPDSSRVPSSMASHGTRGGARGLRCLCAQAVPCRNCSSGVAGGHCEWLENTLPDGMGCHGREARSHGQSSFQARWATGAMNGGTSRPAAYGPPVTSSVTRTWSGVRTIRELMTWTSSLVALMFSPTWEFQSRESRGQRGQRNLTFPNPRNGLGPMQRPRVRAHHVQRYRNNRVGAEWSSTSMSVPASAYPGNSRPGTKDEP